LADLRGNLAAGWYGERVGHGGVSTMQKTVTRIEDSLKLTAKVSKLK
jgi:hypothetical protein